MIRDELELKSRSFVLEITVVQGLQSWTKMLRKMHVVYVILEYFPLKPGSLKIFPPPPKKAMLKCGPNIFAAY